MVQRHVHHCKQQHTGIIAVKKSGNLSSRTGNTRNSWEAVNTVNNRFIGERGIDVYVREGKKERMASPMDEGEYLYEAEAE